MSFPTVNAGSEGQSSPLRVVGRSLLTEILQSDSGKDAFMDTEQDRSKNEGGFSDLGLGNVGDNKENEEEREEQDCLEELSNTECLYSTGPVDIPRMTASALAKQKRNAKVMIFQIQVQEMKRAAYFYLKEQAGK